MIGTKHLVQCHCVLPQYRKMQDPVFHKFVVYSRYDENMKIKDRLARCNNCDAVHRVIDLCKSEIVTKIEDTDVIIDEDEILLIENAGSSPAKISGFASVSPGELRTLFVIE